MAFWRCFAADPIVMASAERKPGERDNPRV